MLYEDYKGVEITHTYFTGHRGVILPTLRRSIAAICRNDRGIGGWYIGIASGVDYWHALTRRVDDYKLSVGISRMYLLYQSTSERYTRSLERSLEQEFRALDRVPSLNRTGGGGGRPSEQPLFFLYLAVRRL